MSEKKVILITGGSKGIGAAVATTLAGPETVVGITHYDQDEKAAQQTLDQIQAAGALGLAYWFDISNYEETKKCIDDLVQNHSRLDVLVNNAGITADALLVRMNEEAWEKVLSVNLKSVFNTTQAAAKVMMKQRFGRIISISSVVAERGNVGQANYAASKAGIIGFAKTVARELASRHITVNVVAPGFINTEMTANLPEKAKEAMMAEIAMGRIGQPQEVADLVAFLASDKAAYITGQVIHINGGLYM